MNDSGGLKRWWDRISERTQSATMALDILTTPLKSNAPERQLIQARLMVTDRRGNLSGDTVNAVGCLQSYNENHVIQWTNLTVGHGVALLPAATVSLLTCLHVPLTSLDSLKERVGWRDFEGCMIA